MVLSEWSKGGSIKFFIKYVVNILCCWIPIFKMDCKFITYMLHNLKLMRNTKCNVIQTFNMGEWDEYTHYGKCTFTW